MKTIQIDGKTFRDLDHDGVLSPYEDWRLTPQERAKDLLSRLSLKEKVGLLLHGTLKTDGSLATLGVGKEYDLEVNGDLIEGRHISSLISRLALKTNAID